MGMGAILLASAPTLALLRRLWLGAWPELGMGTGMGMRMGMEPPPSSPCREHPSAVPGTLPARPALSPWRVPGAAELPVEPPGAGAA